MTQIRLSPHDVVARLSVLLEGCADASVVFDADGTLWTGDVGEETFEHFITEDLFRDDAAEHLLETATALGLEPGSSGREAARAILEGTETGLVDRRAAYETMTWAYAGYRAEVLRMEARHALDARGLPGRRQRELEPIFDFAQREGIRTCVVSASPRIVVEEGLALSGIAVDHVVGGEAAESDGILQPRMRLPLPYGETKTAAVLQLVSRDGWLASFGDSDYDLPMLQAAHLGVMVRPKPSLRRAAEGAANVVELAPGPAPG